MQGEGNWSQLPSVATWLGVRCQRQNHTKILLSWKPGSKAFIQEGFCTELELRNEAAAKIQSFYRYWRDDQVFDTGDASDQESSDTLAENAEDAGDTAVVQAFVASTCSNLNSKSSSEKIVKFGEWDFEQINTWMVGTIELALKDDSRDAGARLVWQRWSAAD